MCECKFSGQHHLKPDDSEHCESELKQVHTLVYTSNQPT